MKNNCLTFKTSYGLSDTEISDLCVFLNGVFQKNTFSKKYIDWLYNRNPDGKAFCITVYDKEMIIGHLAGLPRDYLETKQSNYKGLVAVNTAVKKSHIKYGIFNNLIKCLKDEMTTRGFHFILGIPNKNAVNGWLKRGKAQYLGTLGFYFTFFFPPFSQKKPLKFTKNKQIIEWMLQDPLRPRTIINNLLLSKYKFLPLWLLAITNTIQHKKKNHESINALIYGYIGSMPPRGINIKLPEFLKPAPLHVILIPSGNHIRRFFDEHDIQAKDFDVL